jgi:opacity protein-like surface antigen
MKKGCVALVFFTIWCMSLTVPADASIKGFNLKFAGGYGKLSAGDLNTFYSDTVPYYDVLLASFGFVRQGDYQELRNAWSLAWEFSVDITENFSVGFGFDYCQADNPSSFSWTDPADNDLTVDVKPSLNVVPAKLNLYFAFPVAAKMKTYLSAGFGRYRIKGIFEYLETSQIPGQEGTFRSDITFEGSCLGGHGGLGVEYALSSNLSVVWEGRYRYAKLGNIDGRMRVRDYQNRTTTVEGRIWYFEYLDENTDQYLSGLWFGEKPQNGEIREVHELELDLSGFSLMIGIKIRFGIVKGNGAP